MKKTGVLLFLVPLFFAGQILFGQGLSSVQIDSLVNKSMSTMPQAGIAVAVVQDGKVTHAKGYGVASISSKEKVNENTLFAIASNSKAFTAATLAILVDEGKLSWDDKVVDHIPEFRMYDPYVTANFNIKDLLTHRSGLGLGAGDLMFFPHGNDFTIDDILWNFQYLKPVTAFRTTYDYDNLLYLIAGEVVARVSGMSWDTFVQERIMKPLGMDRSAAIFQNICNTSNVAFPHSSYKGELRLLERHLKLNGTSGAGGGIYSSVNDMSKWLLMNLNGCRYGENLSEQLISEQNHSEMWKPQTNIWFSVKATQRYNSHFRAYGLGWFISDRNGYIVIEHTGGATGMLSSTLMIPELNAGVVVLTNTDPGGYSYQTIRDAILDSFIGVEREDWIASAEQRIYETEAEEDSVLTAVWNIASNAKTAHLDYNDYTGIYRDNWFGNVEIRNENSKLWFYSTRSPKMTGEMFYYKANTFIIKWNYRDYNCDAFASFGLDENGKATSIKLKGISPHLDFSFNFHDLDFKRAEPDPSIQSGPGSYKIFSGEKDRITIPFTMHNGKPLMELEINGRKATLMIDNGVLWDQIWLFGSSLVEELELKPTEEMEIGGSGEGDPTQAFVSSNLTLKFKDIVFCEQPVLVSPPVAGFARMFPGADGQLCNTFFKHFIVEFDFIRNEIILHKPEYFQYTGGGSILDMQANASGTYSIPFSFEMPDETIYNDRVDIDFGGIYPLKVALNNKYSIQLPSDVEETQSRGAQGKSSEFSGKINSMSIGKYTFEKPVVVFGDGKTSRIHPDNLGVIGLPLFMKFDIIFDYFNNRIYLDPNKNYHKPFE